MMPRSKRTPPRCQEMLDRRHLGCYTSFPPRVRVVLHKLCQAIEGNLDPWLAQFSTRAMDFQSRILARTAEFCDLPMELRTAAVLTTAGHVHFDQPACCRPHALFRILYRHHGPLPYFRPCPPVRQVRAEVPKRESGKALSAVPVLSLPSRERRPHTPAPKATAALCHGDRVSGSTAPSHVVM